MRLFKNNLTLSAALALIGCARLRSSPQVIGLLDVFTPAAALEDFNEL